MSGENLNVIREKSAAQGSSDQSPDRFTRRAEDKRRLGRSNIPSARDRLFDYDRIEGQSKALGVYEVDKTDRTPVSDVAPLLHTLHVSHGLANAMEGELYDYDTALFVCYAINGASQVGPYGRVKFHTYDANRNKSTFEYSVIANVLGVEFRRFFRALANEVLDACRNLYFRCNYENPYQVEARELMLLVADQRKLSRMPWLIPDCADAATNTESAERGCLAMSKVVVVGKSTNAVDRLGVTAPVRSLDNFDSSTGQSVSNANDIHATQGQYYQ